ncbi:nitroreductase family deazaflavin-dependent oxidoreductase [Saccharomonospora sp. NPDC046836]|uniref:nitroreductase family deazaflavin-dependent oxidoreductase n=1 Tax=Saccharomonospora sp. NPDC046836 TaxID=3156921 RepID=UPI0033EDE5A9
MPLPSRLARFNRVVTNHITRRGAEWLPGFGVIRHRGRKSGHLYSTPVNAFRTQDGYVVALAYGTRTDWVRNVQAADGCQLRTRGRTVRLNKPRIVHDERRDAMPAAVRGLLGLVDVNDFMYLTEKP